MNMLESEGIVTEEPVAGNPHGGFCEGERVKSQDMCLIRHITGNGDTGLRRNLKLLPQFSTRQKIKDRD